MKNRYDYSEITTAIQNMEELCNKMWKTNHLSSTDGWMLFLSFNQTLQSSSAYKIGSDVSVWCKCGGSVTCYPVSFQGWSLVLGSLRGVHTQLIIQNKTYNTKLRKRLEVGLWVTVQGFYFLIPQLSDWILEGPQYSRPEYEEVWVGPSVWSAE